MNRLIIVGNGFDLAHGLKTSYCDFLDSYLKDALNIFHQTANYDDPLLSLSHLPGQRYFRYPYSLPIDSTDVHGILSTLNSSDLYVVSYKSTLLKRSLEKSKEIRWVDLENDFFGELSNCVDKVGKKVYTSALATLNNQFGFLKNRLEDYLLSVQIDLNTFNHDPAMYDLFRQPINARDVLNTKASFIELKKIMYLNFNYTNTLNKYAQVSAYDTNTGFFIQEKDSVNHIHGVLKSEENKIVFGFGDEYDENYLQFENLKNNDLFRHIKSFAYFKTRNYHELIRFLNDSEFQVFIIGHSCGLSDRTMFRKIFEHGNCLSIKIFYHKRIDGSTDYVDKTYDIARHFTNKGEMREKIVVEPNSGPLPQYNSK